MGGAVALTDPKVQRASIRASGKGVLGEPPALHKSMASKSSKRCSAKRSGVYCRRRRILGRSDQKRMRRKLVLPLRESVRDENCFVRRRRGVQMRR